MKLFFSILLSFYLVSYIFGLAICSGSGLFFTDMSLSGSSHTSPCVMNVTQHINQWQDKFMALEVAIFISLFILVILVVRYLKIFLLPISIHKQRLAYSARAGPSPIHDYFLQALSDGRIQPKIYR